MPSRNRGKPKLKLRDLSRLPLSSEEKKALIEALKIEAHPITAAILGAVMIEHELELLLRRRFVRKDDETWTALMLDNGPLSSFFAKIVMGYAFGMYNEQTRDDLHVVRNVRNAFAHSKKLINFDHELVIDELKKASGRNLPKRFLKRRQTNAGLVLKAGYIIMCLRLVGKFSTKHTRYLRRSNRRFDQKLAARKVPLSPLGSVLASALGVGIGTRGALPLPIRVRQSGDPSSEVPGGSLSVRLPLASKNDRSKDK